MQLDKIYTEIPDACLAYNNFCLNYDTGYITDIKGAVITILTQADYFVSLFIFHHQRKKAKAREQTCMTMLLFCAICVLAFLSQENLSAILLSFLNFFSYLKDKTVLPAVLCAHTRVCSHPLILKKEIDCWYNPTALKVRAGFSLVDSFSISIDSGLNVW